MSAVSSGSKPEPIQSSSLLIPPQKLDNAWHRAFILLCKLVGNFLFTVFFRWRVEGLENIPEHGPFLITVNHLSVMDVPALGTALINRGYQPGVTMFTASKQELFDKPLLTFFMGQFGMFPVYRNQGDINAMRTMLLVLKRGAALGLAAEGARSPTGHLQLFQPGVAKLAIQKRLPIVPAGVSGVEKVLPIGAKLPHFVQIDVRFGPIYELAKYYGEDLSPALLEQAAWEMRERVAELLPEWMRDLPPEQAESRFGSVRSKTSPSPL